MTIITSLNTITILNVNWIVVFMLLIFLILVFGLVVVNGSILFKLMCYEVLYLYININFLFCGFIFQDLTSHIFILVLLTIIAAESAIVLSLIVFHYNLGGELEL